MRELCIDPGKKTGIAIYQNRKLVELDTTDTIGALNYIDNFDIIYIERTRNKYIVPRINVRDMKSYARIAFDCGSVYALATLLIDYAKRKGKTVVVKHPSKTKDKAYFLKKTGWTKASNEHNRDAAVLIF